MAFKLPSVVLLFRYLRSIIVPLAAIGSLCFILSIFLVLYQPVTGPDHIQRIGWQAWSLIAPPKTSQVPIGSGGSTSGPGGVDWWNVSTPTSAVDTATLPLDVWNPLLAHDTGLSEMAVVSCVIPPTMAFGTMCKPHTTVEHDAIKGKWVRVEGNLNIQSGIYFLHLWYRRTRRLDVPLITELRILPEGEEPTPPSQFWQKASISLREGVLRAPALYLWFYAERTRMEMSELQQQQHLVTEMDVLYGEDVPWYGFELLGPPTSEEQPGKVEMVSLAFRKGVKPVPRAPPLHFSRDGRFKIMQVADLHFSVGRTDCRDTPLSPCESSDNLTTTLIGRALDAERPDLVVFTGDQLNGQRTSWDARSVLAKFARAAADRGVPWTAVFGNHDDEDGAGRQEQVRMMQQLPYSLMERGPTDIHGVGNYVLKVKSADASKTHLLTLYFLDSGGYSKGYWDWLGAHPTAYDWIRSSQIDWFMQESGSIGLLERPFTPDGSKNVGDIWTRDPQAAGGQLPAQQSHLAKPNALMFFHIPLPEAYLKADTDPRTSKPLDVGQQLEESGAAKGSDGFFEKGLLRALESDHSATGNAREVKVIANGHCHVSDNCRRVRGMWMCFGGGGSYSGYGKVGFDRRFRIYDISDFGETIATYKRTEKAETVDRMILAGKDAPAPYEGT